MFYLIFIAIMLSFIQICSAIHENDMNIRIVNINEEQIYSVNSDESNSLVIYCRNGSQKLISNLLMSCHFNLIEVPKHLTLFKNENKTQIIEDFYTNKWSSHFTEWIDDRLETHFTIPSFSSYCIGIEAKESFKFEISIKRINIYRLASLLIGLTLFNLGPKLSRHIVFYYSSCITLGVLLSFVLIFIIVGRYFPRKISGVIIMLGSSALMLTLRMFWNHIKSLLITYSYYLFIYLTFVAFVSFGLSYRFGPITNPKTLNLMQWCLQFIGLILIFNCSEVYEYSAIIVLFIIFVYICPLQQLFTFQRKVRIKKRFLSETEFVTQSDIETKKALEELKNYCLSPNCDAWGTICRLKDPLRFARFVNGETHITDEEISVYETSFQSFESMPCNGLKYDNESEDD